MMRRPVIAFILGVIVAISLPFCFVGIMSLVSRDETRMYQGFAKIKPDMLRRDVVQLMGSEGSQSDTFHLGQLAGYEFEYLAAQRSGAAYFLSWHTGVDMIFTVAFDKNDKAIYKASGGT